MLKTNGEYREALDITMSMLGDLVSLQRWLLTSPEDTNRSTAMASLSLVMMDSAIDLRRLLKNDE